MPRIREGKGSEVAQSCPTLCDPMDWGLPGFSVHGIFQARVQEWVAISFSCEGHINKVIHSALFRDQSRTMNWNQLNNQKKTQMKTTAL